MNHKAAFSLLFFLYAFSSGFSQVTFSMRPMSLKLYPRQANDSAAVTIAGDVTANHYKKVIFTLHKNGVLLDSTIKNIHYSGGKAPFLKSYKIHAEKSLYRIKMYIYKNNALQVMLADSVCSGDVFLINGQSNGVAAKNGPGADPNNPWVRSFGTEDNSSSACFSDTSWGLGDCSTTNSHMSIGVWAMRLGKIIVDSTGIPVCIINGAQNGTRIIHHLPGTNHADLNTIYGCLYYRTLKAGVTNAVKGIFWYQGESDTDTSWSHYENRFNTLYSAWIQDFPLLSNVFVIQSRPGCIINAKTLYHQQLREAQRRISINHPFISLIPTVGIPDFDGCHFRTVGYQKLSQRIYDVLCNNIYNKPSIPGSDTPQPLKAFYSNQSKTRISLVFDQSPLWPDTLNGYDLKDYIYLNSSVTVTSGSSSGDTIHLQLSASCNANKISYLPGINYAGSNNIYMGPWLLNTRGVGVPSFYQFPVADSLNINASTNILVCNSDSILLSTYLTGQKAKWYRNGIAIPGAVNSTFYAKHSGNYYLEMTDQDSISISSNTITLTDDTLPLPVAISANGQSSFCTGGNLSLICNDPSNSYQWHKNGNPIINATQSSYQATSNGNYSVEIQQVNGCLAFSSGININQDSLPNSTFIISNQLDNCADTVVTLTGPAGAGYSYHWLKDSIPIGASGQTYVTTNSGAYSLLVTNNFGCSNSSDLVNIPIISHLVTATTIGSSRICKGGNVRLEASTGVGFTYQWFKNNSAIPGALNGVFVATSGGSYVVNSTNASGCVASSPPVIITLFDCTIARLQYKEEEGFRVYPNPFETAVRLEFPVQFEELNDFHFDLTDANGRQVNTLTKSDLKKNEAIEFDTHELTPGIYFYRAFINNNIYSGKIIKQ